MLKKILLVEDDPTLRAVAKVALERVGGFIVEECQSGLEALAKAPVFNPDLVLLDVMLPEMDGPETMAALREQAATSEIPVVFLTAKVRRPEVTALEQSGALGVLCKPFDPMRLSEQVREYWSKGRRPAR